MHLNITTQIITTHINNYITNYCAPFTEEPMPSDMEPRVFDHLNLIFSILLGEDDTNIFYQKTGRIIDTVRQENYKNCSPYELQLTHILNLGVMRLVLSITEHRAAFHKEYLEIEKRKEWAPSLFASSSSDDTTRAASASPHF